MKASILILLLLSLCLPLKIFAQSEYVLPYPSTMPGSKLYIISLVWEKVNGFWRFGSFGQFSYNLHLSDKYLVEAKTLYEYKQYLLATQSLKKSESYLLNATFSLNNAKKEKKDISQKAILLSQAARKHILVLESLKQQLPSTFNWIPEKSQSTLILIHNDLDKSIEVRSGLL